jgi:hypothetical protein
MCGGSMPRLLAPRSGWGTHAKSQKAALAEGEAERKGFAGAEAPVPGESAGSAGPERAGRRGRRSRVMLFDEDTDEDTRI